MNPRPFIVVAALLLDSATGSELVAVPAGIYRPLFAGENDLKEIPVAGFQLAATPVTNGEFLDFVRANLHGIRDLHGLVWEWTGDFNSAIVTGDARGDTGLERQLFCGAGSLGAKDTSNYPAFMRFGFRSSFKAGYTVHNLGFRYARDL